MNRLVASLLFGLAITAPAISAAAVSLVDKDDWKVQLGGFVEMDMFHDSKRSFTEVAGNGAVPRSNTFAGENGRTQFSLRNSRFAFTILPPQAGEWKTKGHMEFDLLGYDPDVSATAQTQSEGSFYTNPTLRVRHAYLNAENDGWTVLAGQYWTLFGWNPIYVVTTASVPPGPGMVYQRTPQLTGMKALAFGDGKLQIGVSVARPSQRDSEMPNLEAGVRYSYAGWSAGFASASGDAKAEPFSVAVSGTMRRFAVPASNAAAPAVSEGVKKSTGSAFAIDALLPVLPSSDGKDVSNTLVLTGEFSSGKGYGDAFPGWTGGLPQLPSGTTGAASQANLDKGQGGWDGAGEFTLVKLQTWNAQLQYHLPSAMGFVTVGHAELKSSNVGSLTPAGTVYDQAKMDFVNFFHDFTPQIRGAIEYAKFTTHYVATNDEMKDDRVGVSAFFRF